MAITSATEPMLGFLGLVLKDASYISINNGNSYILPVDPGPGPVHANNATVASSLLNENAMRVLIHHLKRFPPML